MKEGVPSGKPRLPPRTNLEEAEEILDAAATDRLSVDGLGDRSAPRAGLSDPEPAGHEGELVNVGWTRWTVMGSRRGRWGCHVFSRPNLRGVKDWARR
jgi:hypothetical protein